MILIYVILALILGLIPASIAQKKNQSFFAWWFFGALLFIAALPLAILIKDELEPGMTRCAYCGRQIKIGLMECPKCHRAQPEINASTQASWERIISNNDEVSEWSKQSGQK